MDTYTATGAQRPIRTIRTQKDLPVGIIRVYEDGAEDQKLVAALDNWDDACVLAERWSANDASAVYAVQHDDGITVQTTAYLHGNATWDYIVHRKTAFQPTPPAPHFVTWTSSATRAENA